MESYMHEVGLAAQPVSVDQQTTEEEPSLQLINKPIKKKRKRRCKICVDFKCDKAHDCPGNSNKKNCKCDHRKSRRSCATCKERRCLKANQCPGRGGKKFHQCDCVELSPEEIAATQELNPDGTIKKTKRTRRCAVCIQYNCDQQYKCPGNSNKKHCKCQHRRTKRSCFVCKQHGKNCERALMCGGKGGRKFHNCYCTAYESCPEQSCKENKLCTCVTFEPLKQEYHDKDEKSLQRKKTKRRCASCVKFKCEKAYNCPGNSNKKKCKCKHKKSKRTCQVCKKRYCDRMNICRGKGGAKWHKCECDNLPIPEAPPGMPEPEIIYGEDGEIKKVKRRRRCTVCIKFSCERMFNCPGNSNKKNCKCNHRKSRRTCAVCKEKDCKRATQCAGRGGRKFHDCDCTAEMLDNDYEQELKRAKLEHHHQEQEPEHAQITYQYQHAHY